MTAYPSHTPPPELVHSYLARSLARLYVTARDTEGRFDQYAGLDDRGLTEILARALFAANRQGRPAEPTLLRPMRENGPHPHHLERYTETFLGVEVTTSRDLIWILRALARAYPKRMNAWDLATATGLRRRRIGNRMRALRSVLKTCPKLRIPIVRSKNAGWCLEAVQ